MRALLSNMVTLGFTFQFQKLSKNIEESPALIIDSQSESVSPEYSRDSDFEM